MTHPRELNGHALSVAAEVEAQQSDARQQAIDPLEGEPTVWGLTVEDLHERFWRSRGIQVVRCVPEAAVDLDADLYLLAIPHALTIFDPAAVADRLYWNASTLMRIRLHDRRRREYDERILLDASGAFVRIHRQYDRLESRLVRFGLTHDAKVAQAWVECANAAAPWRALQRRFARRERSVASAPGRCYFGDDAAGRAAFLRHLVQIWREPDATVAGLQRVGKVAWAHQECDVSARTRFVGPVWVGCGRGADEPPLVVGPGVMWDRPGLVGAGATATGASPGIGETPVPWNAIKPSAIASRVSTPQHARRHDVVKRTLDIVFAVIGLTITAILAPAIMLAIWLEDGRPFVFGHKREKRGGAEFRCWKFRSMYRDAEARKAELAARNEADGPQFFITDDPRVTRVGHVLRRFNLDELPQFWNVLIGDMSIVGPRPSPRSENQYHPAWRNARLSVRPGVTGLWQVCRSRKGGNDFQEWIKYDFEYVQKQSLLMDLKIIFQSVRICLLGERKG